MMRPINKFIRRLDGSCGVMPMTKVHARLPMSNNVIAMSDRITHALRWHQSCYNMRNIKSDVKNYVGWPKIFVSIIKSLPPTLTKV